MIRILALMLLPVAAHAQVAQGTANADFTPAFTQQVRAPALPPTSVTVTVFAEGLDSPWGIAPLEQGQFLVTERSGSLRLVNADGSLSRALSGLPDVAAQGQGG
jgi:glucose/arabinose dehydrogenase